MPVSALALVIFVGLIHASWNIAAKKAGGDARFACFTALVMMVVWAPVGLWLGWQAAALGQALLRPLIFDYHLAYLAHARTYQVLPPAFAIIGFFLPRFFWGGKKG